MMKKLLVLILTVFISNCTNNIKIAVGLDESVVMSKKMNYGFTVTFSEMEDFTNFKTFSETRLYKDNLLVFEDTLIEFELNHRYPVVRRITTGHELLLLVNDRPSNYKLLKLTVRDDNHLSQDLIPAFEMKPQDIDSDGKPELVGVMSYYEMAGERYEYMPYLPILVYEYTAARISLDSSETKNINTRVYDTFYGFEYSEKYSFRGNERFENEMVRYKNPNE